MEAGVRHQVTPARLTSPSSADAGPAPGVCATRAPEGRCPPSSATPASDPRPEKGQEALRPGHTSEPVQEVVGLGLGPSAAAAKTGCCRPWAAPRGVPCTQQSCFPRLRFAQEQNRPPKAAACRCASAPRVGRRGPGQEAPDGERPGPGTQGPLVPPPACCQRPRRHHGGRTCEVSVPVTDTGVRLGSSQHCGQSWCAASGCHGPPSPQSRPRLLRW